MKWRSSVKSDDLQLIRLIKHRSNPDLKMDMCVTCTATSGCRCKHEVWVWVSAIKPAVTLVLCDLNKSDRVWTTMLLLRFLSCSWCAASLARLISSQVHFVVFFGDSVVVVPSLHGRSRHLHKKPNKQNQKYFIFELNAFILFATALQSTQFQWCAQCK